METKYKLTVTRRDGERNSRGKKEKVHQGTWIKDPWTKTMGVRRIEYGR